jgi:hypothetical protein
MKYKLDINRDVDSDGDAYMLWLPFGYRFSDDLVHTRGFDTMQEVRDAAKNDVISCDCDDCKKSIKELAAKKASFIKEMLQ